MHGRPKGPRWEAREPYKPQVGYGIRPAYDREIPLIPVTEWFGFRVTCHPPPNDIRDVLALLDSGLSYAWHHHRSFRLDAQQISSGSNDMCGVANSKDLWKSRYRQVWSDDDLSGLVCFCF